MGGFEENKQTKKEVVPGLKALRQKRAIIEAMPEVTEEEIEEHFMKIERRIAQEKAEKKQLAS